MSLAKHKSLIFFFLFGTNIPQWNFTVLLNGGIWSCGAHSLLILVSRRGTLFWKILHGQGDSCCHKCQVMARPRFKNSSKWDPQRSEHLKALVLCISHYYKFVQSWTVGERFDLDGFEDMLLTLCKNRVLKQAQPQLSPYRATDLTARLVHPSFSSALEMETNHAQRVWHTAQ